MEAKSDHHPFEKTLFGAFLPASSLAWPNEFTTPPPSGFCGLIAAALRQGTRLMWFCFFSHSTHLLLLFPLGNHNSSAHCAALLKIIHDQPSPCCCLFPSLWSVYFADAPRHLGRREIIKKTTQHLRDLTDSRAADSETFITLANE